MHIGLLSIIENPMDCLLAMVFFLTMKVLEGEKPLLLEKLPEGYQELNLD